MGVDDKQEFGFAIGNIGKYLVALCCVDGTQIGVQGCRVTFGRRCVC